MIMQIAIVEDDEKDYLNLKTNLDKFSQENNIPMKLFYYSSGEAFLNEYKPIYDIVFLDVQLPGLSGMEVAKKLRELDNLVSLIFTTNIASLAIEGYQYNANDYLLKPIKYETIETKMKKITKNVKIKTKTIPITMDGKVKLIELSSLLYIESFGHNLVFHTIDGNFEVRDKKTMKNLEENLSEYNFGRCSVSYLVNLSFLSGIDNNEVVLLNKERLPISRNRKKDFVEKVFETLKNSGGLLL